MPVCCLYKLPVLTLNPDATLSFIFFKTDVSLKWNGAIFTITVAHIYFHLPCNVKILIFYQQVIDTPFCK